MCVQQKTFTNVKIIAEKGSHAQVIAKIEKPEAIDNIDAIIEATDAIMVARGDLGVEMPMEEVPGLQKLSFRNVVIYQNLLSLQLRC